MTSPGHNGGPPLADEHVPEWGPGGIGTYFAWRSAHAAARKDVSWDTMLRRQRRAELIGLTYDEYTLEILERGRHLGPDDAERVEAIKRARAAPALVEARPKVAPKPGRRGVPRPSPLSADRDTLARRGR